MFSPDFFFTQAVSFSSPFYFKPCDLIHIFSIKYPYNNARQLNIGHCCIWFKKKIGIFTKQVVFQP